jgi:Cu/Ag efflux pump CusA
MSTPLIVRAEGRLSNLESLKRQVIKVVGGEVIRLGDIIVHGSFKREDRACY